MTLSGADCLFMFHVGWLVADQWTGSFTFNFLGVTPWHPSALSTSSLISYGLDRPVPCAYSLISLFLSWGYTTLSSWWNLLLSTLLEWCHDTVWLRVHSYWSVWGCMSQRCAHPLISFFLSWGYRLLMAQIAVHRAIWITHAIDSIFLPQSSQGLSLWESLAPTACLLFSSFFCCTGSKYWFTFVPANFGPATQIHINRW